MRRIFRGSMYALLGMLILFFITIIFVAGFPEGTMIADFAAGVLLAVLCTTPILLTTAAISGISSLLQRNSYAGEKMKNDFLAMADENPERLEEIMNQLSPSDRAYMQQVLSARRLGVSDDGELMSLDELLETDQQEDEGYNSLHLG